MPLVQSQGRSQEWESKAPKLPWGRVLFLTIALFACSAGGLLARTRRSAAGPGLRGSLELLAEAGLRARRRRVNGPSCRYNGSNYICTAVGCKTIKYNVVNGYCYGANYCGPGNIRWNNYQCTKPCTIKHKCDNECESCYGVPCNYRCYHPSSCTGFCSGCCKTFRSCISS
jgi:hypothetical protein